MKHTRTKFLAILVGTSLVAAACGDDDDSADEAADDAAAEETDEAADDGGETDEADATDDGDAAEGGDEATTDDGAAEGGAELSGTLRVLVHQNPPMVEWMESFNDDFEAANPGVSVDMQIVNDQERDTVNQTRLTAGDLDVTVISTSGFATPVQDYMTDATPPGWQQLIDAGLLMDLSDEPWVANYDQAAITDGGSFEGSVYGIPTGSVSYSGMFVNLDLLADAGVEVPTTWDELVASCDAVKEAGYECMTAGGADGWPIFVGSYGLLGAMYPDQAGLVEGLWTGSAAWNDEQGQQLFERYEMYANEMLEDGVTGLAHDAAIIRYAAGDVAYAPTGVWQAPALEGAEPGFEWTYIPFPGSDDAADNQYLFGKYDQTWAIAAETPVPDVAKAYLAAFSEPETYNSFVNAVGFLPTQPTAELDSTLGAAVAPLLENFQVGFEQYYVGPAGAGQWANGSQAAQWFYNGDFSDPVTAADQAQADFAAGL